MELTRASKDIQGGIEICDLHQKRLGRVDKVICGLGQMWLEWDVTLCDLCDHPVIGVMLLSCMLYNLYNCHI